MHIHILDVAHGFCAAVTTDDGRTFLVDCGDDKANGVSPANYLASIRCQAVDRLFITNYDEDHLSGLPELRRSNLRLPIQCLHRNRAVTADDLLRIKRCGGPLGAGTAELIQMIREYRWDESPGILAARQTPEIATFATPYPTFTDTNNLSLVVFLHAPGLSIIFPGDLERPGWEWLLRDTGFLRHLQRVNVFVASHHGRKNGYVRDVFDFCRPAIVIISDEPMQYDTQEHCYAQHASGILWNGSEIRRVLTTRCDGSLTISTLPTGTFYLRSTR